MSSIARGHLRLVDPDDLLEPLFANTHDVLEQEIMAYIAEMHASAATKR